MNNVELFHFLYLFRKKVKLEISQKTMKQDHSFGRNESFSTKKLEETVCKYIEISRLVILNTVIWRFSPNTLVSCYILVYFIFKFIYFLNT